MKPADQLRFAVSDRINNTEIGPSCVPLGLIGEFQKDVSDFLKGGSRDVDLMEVNVSIEEGSLAFAASGLIAASTLWVDLDRLKSPDSLGLIDPKRASVVQRWQNEARQNPHRHYNIVDQSKKMVFLKIDSTSSFTKTHDVWVQVEKYLYGKIVDLGGKTKANVHLETEGGQILTIASSHELLASDERNRLYRPALLHVTAEESLLTGELRALRLIAFEAHQPTFDESEFKRMVELGTKAWASVGDPGEWLETLRGGGLS